MFAHNVHHVTLLIDIYASREFGFPACPLTPHGLRGSIDVSQGDGVSSYLHLLLNLPVSKFLLCLSFLPIFLSVICLCDYFSFT